MYHNKLVDLSTQVSNLFNRADISIKLTEGVLKISVKEIILSLNKNKISLLCGNKKEVLSSRNCDISVFSDEEKELMSQGLQRYLFLRSLEGKTLLTHAKESTSVEECWFIEIPVKLDIKKV